MRTGDMVEQKEGAKYKGNCEIDGEGVEDFVLLCTSLAQGQRHIRHSYGGTEGDECYRYWDKPY